MSGARHRRRSPEAQLHAGVVRAATEYHKTRLKIAERQRDDPHLAKLRADVG